MNERNADSLYYKYLVTKADGSPVDPKADYFVLRLDTDPAARLAAYCYAKESSRLTNLQALHYPRRIQCRDGEGLEPAHTYPRARRNAHIPAEDKQEGC